MTKKTIKKILILVIILAIIFILLKIVRLQDIILKQIYPIKYQEYVEKYSEEYEVDKYIIYAIIKAESNFDTNVQSQKGAKGLMQLMEDTAEEMANTVQVEILSEEDLFDAEKNVNLGIAYYAYLLEYYNRSTTLALTAYNAGMGNTDSWISEGIIKEDGENIENIPYTETNNYVRKILNNYQMYLKLYSYE